MYHRRRAACGHRRRTCSVLCPRRRSGVVFRDNGGLRPVVRHRVAVRPPALYRPDRIRHHRTVRDPRADRVGCRPLRGRLLFPGPVLGPAAARPRLQAAAHKAGLVLAVRPSLRVERRQGGLYPYDGTGGRFDAAGRTDPQDERGGYVREDRSAQGIPFGVTRNSVYCFSRFSGTPNRPPPTCVTLLFNACGLNTQNPANVLFAGFCCFIRCISAERQGYEHSPIKSLIIKAISLATFLLVTF